MPKKNEIIGPYRLIEKLGSGQFGVVWKAEKHEVIAPPCAVKFPTGDDVDFEAVKREALVWVRASGHPNVLPIIEAGVYDGELLIVSEYAQSGSLLDWLHQHGGQAPSIEAAAEIVSGILAGLEHLHRLQIIHRDLKPANILMQGDIPRLADFGLARVLRSTIAKSAVAGSPAYMAPEAFKNTRTVQTDLWAAGVIFHQLLSGRLPFPGDDAASCMYAILHEPPLPLPNSVGPPLQTFVATALEKDPARRFQSAAQMRDALRKVMIGNTAEATRRTLPPTPLNPSPNDLRPQAKRYGRILAGVLGSLLLAYGGWTMIPKTPPSDEGQTFVAPTPVSAPSTLKSEGGGVFSEDLGGGVKIPLVRVPAGKFMMGSPADEERRSNDEGPQREVRIEGFLMGKFEVTQRQWRAVAALRQVEVELQPDPSKFKGDDLPVEQVSWLEAKEFIARLNGKLGLNERTGYRLPSEAEWEYAARAGTTTPFAFGATITPAIVNYNGNYPYGGAATGEYRAKTVAVGSLGKANAWGLFDMHGNVWEWCEDDWHGDYNGAPTDGRAWVDVPSRGTYRVNRGGGWSTSAVNCRSADRDDDSPGDRYDNLGFRLLRTLP
jgi:formylglycine-generating enzyme required for sulfatase activity